MSTLQRHRKTLGALAAVTSVALLAACGGSSGSSSDEGGTDEVTVRADVYFTGAVLPLVAGVQTGIFEEHGLTVDLKEGNGSATTIQTVANGSDDIGYADAATMVQSVGQGMPVTMVAGMVQKSPLAVFAFQDSGIDKPSDLVGETAGYTPGSAAERLFPAYAQATGIDETKVTFRNVDIPTRTQLFLGDKTDFTFGLTNVSKPNLELACDCELVTMTYADAGVQTLSSGIVVGNEFIQDNPETVEEFLAALEEAVEFADNDTDAAVDAFFEMATESQLEPGQVADQWHNSSELLHTDNTADQGFGCIATDDWKETIDLMEEYGDVTEGSATVSDVASNEFLPGDCTDTLSEGSE
ncbi:ABC transporter substrate-binding protein [Janibacter cremeus]|uniref:NitT/TauT family transport system substrate-binding protein n=1 Tax=Janibacter cremeus TaxID=1285192 RepID=A0A852VTR5_9MICO|nr:NitT/TauT family transport system substrate-binding protein [Janibacter cremeus]